MTCKETLAKLTETIIEKINEPFANEAEIAAYLEGCNDCLYMQFPEWHYPDIDKWYFDMKDAIG